MYYYFIKKCYNFQSFKKLFVACFGISDAATMDPVTTLKRKNQDSVPLECCIFCKDVKKRCSAANEGLRSTVTGISRIKDIIVD